MNFCYFYIFPNYYFFHSVASLNNLVNYQDFVSSVDDEELMQDVLLSVSQNRKDLPTKATKKNLSNFKN